MEVGKYYTFYNNKYLFGRKQPESPMVGRLMGEYDGVYAFELIDSTTLRYSDDIHAEFEPLNVNDFIEHASKAFQNTFLRNVSITHDDYEFKLSVQKEVGEYINLNAIEECINETLEDYWSVLLEEINHSIQIKSYVIELQFRVHDIHELSFRHYKEDSK